MNDIYNLFDRSITQSLISSVLWALLVLAADKLRNWAQEGLLQYGVTATKSFIAFVGLSWLAGTLLVSKFIERPTLFYILSGVAVFWLLWREMRQYWKVGLIRADTTVSAGIDYTKALNLCKNRLDFLGLGASKLTKDMKAFETAVRLCNRPDQPVRLLLTRPDNANLVKAAKMQGKDQSVYSRAVEDSLRQIHDLKKNSSLNIQIRFYPAGQEYVPLFRLMFIDGVLCLVSYYIFGEGDGSQLPQLVCRKSDDDRDIGTFYYAFKLYFEKLWSESAEWDGTLPVPPSSKPPVE